MVYRLDALFGALADPTRRRLLSRLRRRELSISELAEPFRMSLPAVSKHLRVLERAGLVRRRREGRSWQCRLVPTPMREAVSWFDDYRLLWESQLDKLEAFLSTSTIEESDVCPPPVLPTRPSGSPGSSTPRRRRSSPRGRRSRG